MTGIYDMNRMGQVLKSIMDRQLPPAAVEWLSDSAAALRQHFHPRQFSLVFTMIPRKAGKKPVELTEEEMKSLHALRKGFSPGGWPAGRLCRAWWLLQLPPMEEAGYLVRIEELFQTAGMEEQVALYASLPLLSYPEKLAPRASEGVRTNIGVVFEAVALDNPYPSEYLEEGAWNQLVLKAFFLDKPVHRFIGLDERANRNLAHILCDYAHERWSAGRTVNPQLWRPVGKYIDEKITGDMERLLASDDPLEAEAAALACSQSGYPEAAALLERYPALKRRIERQELSWQQVAEKLDAQRRI